MNFIKSIFSSTPGPDFGYYTLMILISILLVIASIVFGQIYNRKRKDDIAFKKLFKKVPARLFILGALIAFLTAVRYESIPYFSMRLWLYLSLLATVLYLGKTIHTYVKIYPTKHQMAAKRHLAPQDEKKSAYLPNKKRK